MAKTTNNRQSASTIAAEHTVETVCSLFEAELKLGNRPEIEQYHAGWEEPERSKLIFELIRLEIQYAHGERRSRDDYLNRFPDHRDVVRDAFDQTVAPPNSDDLLNMSAALRTRWYLGQGGLGIVYVAEDEQLQRDTAVKFIQEKHRNDARSQEQFRIEAQLTGRLEHPGIVPVYGVGTAPDGRMFYAMRLIRGERLDEAIAKYHQQDSRSARDFHTRQIALHELLNRFSAVCKTIAYAHNRGVVHRDIKPGNIMLGRYGETIVIDWGLGAHVGRQGIFKDSSEKTLMPGSGTNSSQNSRGGTPAFMSPEQATGKEDIGPLSDVYSLGATLYMIITGDAPFRGNHVEVLPKVMRGEFLRPAEVRSDVSKALEAICLKAMSLDPQKRYATALELSDDIERFLADAAVTAYEEPVSRRFARWARRHRTLAQSGLMALALLTVCGAVASIWMGRDAREQREMKDEAVNARQLAEVARQSEQKLRKEGLLLSAVFAARTIANQVDLRWRILEKEAAEDNLQTMLETSNASPKDKAAYKPIQQWLEERIDKDYRTLSFRAWSIYANDGTCVASARFIKDKEGKGKVEQAGNPGENIAYRDYFNGQQDFAKDKHPAAIDPLNTPHVSTVYCSAVDRDLGFALSVPVWATKQNQQVGVMAMAIKLGDFADLKLPLSADQVVMLVDGRQYFMQPRRSSDGKLIKGENGEGLVLYHRDLAKKLDETPLPHVDNKTVAAVRKSTADWKELKGEPEKLTSLIEKFSDPVLVDSETRRLAAVAPVLLDNRPASLRDTEWFVIVEQ